MLDDLCIDTTHVVSVNAHFQQQSRLNETGHANEQKLSATCW